MPYRFEVPRPFKDSEQEYLEFDDNVPIDEAISASDKYYTKQFFNEGLHMALGALIKDRINSEDFISGMGDKLGDFMETLNLAVKGQNKYTDPTSEYFNPEYNKTQEDAVNEAISLVGLGGSSFGPAGGAGTAGMFVSPKRVMSKEQIHEFEKAELKSLESIKKSSKAVQKDLIEMDREQLWKEFGIIRGPDGKLRAEIDDVEARLQLHKFETDKKRNYWLDDFGGAGPKKLGDYFKHDELYKYYPELKEMILDIDIRKANATNPNKGGFYESQNKIKIRAKDQSEASASLLHEIQHKIQSIEGFARGGSPRIFKERRDQINNTMTKLYNKLMDGAEKSKLIDDAWYKKLEDKYGPDNNYTVQQIMDAHIDALPKPNKQVEKAVELYKKLGKLSKHLEAPAKGNFNDHDYDLYRDLYGEIEARNTEARRFMTEFVRREYPPTRGEITRTGKKILKRK